MKLKLVNNDEIIIKKVKTIENGICLYVQESSLDALETQLKQEGILDEIQIISDADSVIGKYYNMMYASIYKEDEDIIVTLRYKQIKATVDVSKQLSEMKASLDLFKQETTDTQNLQDGAIEELASIAASLSENYDSNTVKGE